MPIFRRLEAHDPKHGSVGDLCKNLGYGSDRKGTPRSRFFLSTKVAVFRKNFLETDADIDHFPLEYESTTAQRCASNFLRQNLHLFQDSGEARVFNYPIYPQDEERLLEGLAKLMSTQEYVRRRNANSAEAVREKRAREEKENSIQDQEQDQSDSEQSEFTRPPSSPASSVRSFQEYQDANDRRHIEQVRENIAIHLEFIYPLDGTIEASSPRFLLDNSEKWPQDAKRFAWRYLHEHSLYHARKTNPEAVIQFAAKLLRYHGIAYTEERRVLVQRRCRRQITYCAGLWCGYGLLEEMQNGVFRKTAEFEALWRDRRKKWIDLVHNGNPSGVIELETTLPVSGAAENGTGRKRDMIQTRPFDDLQFHDTSTGPAAKRPRVNLIERPFTDSGTGSEEDNHLDTQDHETQPVEEETREARPAPEAPIVTPLADQSQRSAIEVPAELEKICNTTKQRSSSAMKTSSMTQAPPSLHSDHSSAPSNAKLDETQDTPPMLEKRTTPYAFFGSFLNFPFDADTALVKSSPKAAADKPPEKPKLHYILPSFHGGLDHNNPLPRETWWACNISQFFNVVASRAGCPQESLQCLTFTQNWGEVETFVVHRFEGDQCWEEIKQRVKGKFLKARNSIKKRTARFELWVECGDTTNLDEVEENEDC